MALLVPLGKLQLKIAVVPGKTPFLTSNTLMRTLAAQIDCQHRQFRSAMLDQPIDMQLTSRGLFLVDLNEIPLSPQRFARSCRDSAKSVTETYLSDTAPTKTEAVRSGGVAARVAEIENLIQRQNQSDKEHQSPKANPLKSRVNQTNTMVMKSSSDEINEPNGKSAQ